MNNSQIIEQWKQAEETANQNVVSSIKQLNILQNQIQALERQKTELVQKKKQAVAAQQSTTNIDAQISQLDAQIEPLYVRGDELDAQIAAYRSEAANARREYQNAQAAPSNSNNTPSPGAEATSDSTTSPADINTRPPTVTEENTTDSQQIKITGDLLKSPPVITDPRADENGVSIDPRADENGIISDPRADEDGVPIDPRADEDGVPIDPRADENGVPLPIIIKDTAKPVPDWRFRISLSDSANYFYNVAEDADILAPLKATNGVIFPYTPSINVTYSANYESVDVTHSNYKIHNYRNSSIDAITITGDFTAQDSTEAEYVLAVIHFFRCATKMFYGKDTNPKAGTPPPLCYLTGHGAYAFDKHPVVITSFTLNYPTDVDYISTRDNTDNSLPMYNKPIIGRPSRVDRLLKSGLNPGGTASSSGTNANKTQTSTRMVTRIPSKLQVTISAIPIVTRNNISNNFSLKDYAKGSLLRGTFNQRGQTGGIW